MRTFFCLTTMLLMLTGCHQLGDYRNRDAWRPHPDVDYRPLNGQPKALTEYHYQVYDTDQPDRQRREYYTYGFNTQGNLISRQRYVNDSLLFTWKGVFDSSGYQWTDTNLMTHQIESCRTRSMGDGRYKAIYKYEKKTPYAETLRFSTDGSELLADFYDDTTAQGTAAHYHYYYKAGDRFKLLKVEGETKGSEFKKKYYYSKWDTPDSIELYAVKFISWVVEREYFTINKHGDPTRHLKVDGKDTVDLQQYQYRYDDHGNWNRKITTNLKIKHIEKNAPNPYIPRVVDRTFVY